MEIRKMRLQDIAQLAALEKECFSDPWSAASFAYELNNPISLWLVCADHDRVIGYIGSQSVFPEADIMNTAVLPEYRRQGIGRKLLSSLANALKEQGIESVSLEVRVSNAPAIRLYEQMDFIEVGRRPGYYRHPKEDALILRKELS